MEEDVSKAEIEAYQAEIDAELAAWEDMVKQKPVDASEEAAKVERESLAKLQGLSEADMKELLYKTLSTKKDLKNWIKLFLHVDLPDSTIDPESNSNPLDMVWRLYETAVHYDKLEEADRHLKSLFYCSRGSFKTICACIVELLILLHTNRNIVHIGMIESQAKNAYNLYLRPFLDKPFIRDHAKVTSILERSEVKNNKEERTHVQVIPLTLNKTSSPRAQLVVKDEIDKVKGEQVQAYQNVHGMLTMTNDKQMAMEFDISSRDSAYGMVQEVIDSAQKTGCKVYHWNRMDITERCPDERSGCIPTPVYLKNDTLIAISEEEYLELGAEEQKLYKMEWMLNGCLENCGMAAACRGYLKNQKSKCKWLKPVKETEQAILSAPSEDLAISQLLCRVPPTTGLVYGDFSPKKNMLTPNEMYFKWKGVPHKRKNLTTEELIKDFKKEKVNCYVGVDAGFHHPACVLMFIDDKEQVFIVKEFMPIDMDSPELAQWLEDNWKKYRPNRVFVDPESPDCTRAIKKKHFNVSDKVDKHRQPGIATVKGFIRLPATQDTKFFLSVDCMGVKYEMGKWSYKESADGKYTDETEKTNDHSLDAIRYVLHTLFGKAKADLLYRENKIPADIGDSDAYREAGKQLNKEKLSPQAAAAILGQKVIDNRDQFFNKDGEKEAKDKASATRGDFTDY